ncbi:HTH-type transcriptional regulator DmlR [mine drainage metagenome]|uniref:HTH-type transcriptional regulator DmlR n=1 Tax=mine drainage metagenome TaxID=410659 RepID=A0A1J5QXG2_9ZZZZ
MENMNWDDLRVLLAVARTRSLSAAALQLGNSASTLGRRIALLEQALGVTLFVRHASGYRLTEDGEVLLDEARRVEDAIVQLRGRASDRGREPAGHVRLATNEALANLLILPRWKALVAKYPKLTLELVTGAAVQDMYRRNADLALRLVRPETGNLTVRKLGVQAYAVYARRGLVGIRRGMQRRRASGRSGSPMETLPWIGWDEEIQHLVQARWQRQRYPDAAFALTTNSLFSQLAAAEQGLGLAVLPCYIADARPKLERCLPPAQCVSQDIWLVIQRGLRASPRVRVVADMLAEVVHEHRRVLAGI